MNVNEREKIDQSVYKDFIKELEMLNQRLFELERKTGDSEKMSDKMELERQKEIEMKLER